MNPTSIGRYEIKSEVGRGGMATVYKAYDPRFERDVAVKLLPAAFMHDPQFRLRFEREAKTIAMLEHPAIVPVYDFGEQDEQPYLVMRYMSGGSLSDRLKDGALPVDQAVGLVERLAPALDAAHTHGIIHRDLKPANILYDQYGNAFLSDFGIAHLAGQSAMTLTGDTILGTPSYMSPEQVQGDRVLDGRSDIYSLGVILYQMLAGKVPFKADTPTKTMLMHVLEPAPEICLANPQLPAGIEPVIARALAKDPEERYLNAAELVQALHAVVQGTQAQPAASPQPVPPPGVEKFPGVVPEATLLTPSRGLPPVNAPPANQPRSKAVWLVIGLVAIGIVLVAVTGYAILGRRGNASPALAQNPASPTSEGAGLLEPTPLPATPTAALVNPPVTPLPSPTPPPLPTSTPTLIPTDLPTETPLPTLAIPVIGGADKIALLKDNDIWIANLDGSELTQLTDDGAAKSSLQWSPDGQAVHYILGKCINSVDINTLRIDNLACFESADFLEAFEISPDGERVAISLNRELFILPYDPESLSQAKYRRDLQAMADCEILAPYSHNDKVIAVKSARWSRDGQQIAVVRKGVDNGQQVDLVHLLDIADCTTLVDRLDEFPATRFKMKDYAVSPIIENLAWDGTYLFALNSFKRNDGFGDLWIYSTELHRAYQSAPIDEGCCYRDPAFSPDGSHLLFVFQDMSKTPENVIKLYYVPYASLGTGMKYAPLPLPEDFFTDPRARPMPALRPAP